MIPVTLDNYDVHTLERLVMFLDNYAKKQSFGHKFVVKVAATVVEQLVVKIRKEGKVEA